MGMELFDLPPAPHPRLPPAVHHAVFGELPTSLVHALDTAEVAEAVQALLTDGWRAGQLATQVGALPAGTDPAGAVLALLRQLRAVEPPDRRWASEKQTCLMLAGSRTQAPPASPESQQRWLSQIRSDLGAPRPPRAAPPGRVRPPCALCGAAGELFVTKAVRLCTGCVERLETGQLRWDATG